jgi:hypothetical protein
MLWRVRKSRVKGASTKTKQELNCMSCELIWFGFAQVLEVGR